jgi:hypothetical protein
MILPTRGAPVDTNRRAEIRAALEPDEVVRRIDNLIDRDEIRLTEIFSDQDVHQLCEELNIEFRERDFTPAITLSLFVSQSLSRGDACSTVVTQFNRERKRQGLAPCSEDASAFCKARARLSVKLIDTLADRIVSLLKAKTQKLWKWKARNVYLVDGLVFRAPDTKANQEIYPQPSTQKNGLGFPQVRCLVTTCLATGCIVHYNTAAMKGKLTGEVSLFREKHGDFVAGDIVVADSNFESFYDSVLLARRGVDMVCGIKGCRKSPFEGVCEAIEKKIITLSKPKNNKNRFTDEQWEQLPDSVQYRSIRYRITGRTEVLTIVTTLLDSKQYSAEDIAELYGLRWDVETDIASWKTTMGYCDLRCHTPENLDREIAVGVLAYNLVRSLMNDAAAVLEIHPREISFSRSRDTWISFSDELKTSVDLMWIVLSATSRLVRDRPGRDEPREIKRRNQSKYSKLKKPRPSRAKRIAAETVKPPDKP